MRDMKDSEKSKVPKFASFRPKPQINLPPERSAGDTAASRDYNPNLKLPATSKTSKDRVADIDHHDVPGRSKAHAKGSRHYSLDHSKRGASKSIEDRSDNESYREWDSTPEAYLTDTKGDPNNLVYGTMHRYVIPSYFRSGSGAVVGLSTSEKIDRTRSNEKGIVFGSRYLIKNGREQYTLAKHDRDDRRELRIRRDQYRDPALDNGEDFVSLRAHGKKRKRLEYHRRASSASGASTDEGHRQYSSAEEATKFRETLADGDVDYATSTSGTDEEVGHMTCIDEATKHRSIELSRRVDKEPMNARAWIDLINHQDNLLGVSGGKARRQRTTAEKRSVAEVKLSIYERALQQIDNGNMQREHLVIGMMDEGSKVWDLKTLSRKWSDTLKKNPALLRLWTKYLDFQQTNFLNLHYEECRTMYLDSLKALDAIHLSEMKISEGQDVNRVRIYIFLRLTLFMRESGYVEHAVGLWQALLEFNYFRPAISCDQQRPSFEAFWESEVARIGEKDAVGWRLWTEQGGVAPPPRTDRPVIPPSEDRLFDNWACLERDQALNTRMPARTVDDVREDDPYRVILFADVREALFYTQDTEYKSDLLNAFLAFCRLPSAFVKSTSAMSHDWQMDTLVANDAIEESDKSLDRWFPASVEGLDPSAPAQAHRGPVWNFPVRSFCLSPDSLFPDVGRWLSVFDPWASKYDGDKGPVELEFVRRALKMLVDIGAGGDDLAQYYLAWEFANDPKGARKVAKNLLRKHATSLKLYNSYALIEARTGNMTVASHVLGTALTLSQTLPKEVHHDAILLWRTRVWECLTKEGNESALSCLLAYPESGAVPTRTTENPMDLSPSAILRANRALLSGRDYTLSATNYHHAIHFADCIALLTYLSQHLNLEAAIASFDQTSSVMRSRNLTLSAPHQLLHQMKAKLLYHHMTHTSYFKPTVIRDVLAESIRLFPTNTIFLSLYVHNEARFRIDDRVRAIMSDVVLRSTLADNKTSTDDTTRDITGLLFSVYTELHRGVTMGSNTHSIRAAFENAVASESGRSSPTLWKLYLLFEKRQGELSRVKDVFYRGVRACPWVKNFYLLAFEDSDKKWLEDEGLGKIYEVLVEKELRVHVDLGDIPK